MKKRKNVLWSLLIALNLICHLSIISASAVQKEKITLSNLPDYSGEAYVELNGNVPGFSKTELTEKAFEEYSELDDLGRSGVAFANVCTDTMPTEERSEIGMIKPSGWHTVKYDNIDGKYLYNRCHLIGYQLTGENANEQNLVTGTRYMNIEGMLLFENKVVQYVENTDNHVLYRVTPVFKGDNLLASGVQIEACSVEDKGKGVCFNVYCYNVQPDITIDYSDGSSRLSEGVTVSVSLSYSKYSLTVGESKMLSATVSPKSAKVTWHSSNNKVATVSSTGKVTAKAAGTATITARTSNGLKAACKITVRDSQNTTVSDNDTSFGKCTYILNTNTKKFHIPSCPSVDSMKDKNKKVFTGDREDVISQGYSPCKRCHP